jgi:hypothetical protein
MGVVLAGMIVLFAHARVSNCGGNSAALSACAVSMMELDMAADAIGQFTNINQLPEEERIAFVRDSQSLWNPGAKTLVRTNINLKGVSKQILLVCDTPFNNVPQPTIWNGFRHNPAHAVGYSDGSTGLITPEQFKEINLSEFIDASLLTNRVTSKDERVSE